MIKLKSQKCKRKNQRKREEKEREERERKKERGVRPWPKGTGAGAKTGETERNKVRERLKKRKGEGVRTRSGREATSRRRRWGSWGGEQARQATAPVIAWGFGVAVLINHTDAQWGFCNFVWFFILNFRSDLWFGLGLHWNWTGLVFWIGIGLG